MITTKGMSVPEALRTIAGWIEGGEKLQVGDKTGAPCWTDARFPDCALADLDRSQYRAKPRKPVTGWACVLYDTDDSLTNKDILPENARYTHFIEVTDEVRERCADLLEDV